MQAGDREYLYLLSFSSSCLWGPEAEIKTGNGRDERRKRVMESCPWMGGGTGG